METLISLPTRSAACLKSALLVTCNKEACEGARQCPHTMWPSLDLELTASHVLQLGGTHRRMIQLEFALSCEVICYGLSRLPPGL